MFFSFSFYSVYLFLPGLTKSLVHRCTRLLYIYILSGIYSLRGLGPIIDFTFRYISLRYTIGPLCLESPEVGSCPLWGARQAPIPQQGPTGDRPNCFEPHPVSAKSGVWRGRILGFELTLC